VVRGVQKNRFGLNQIVIEPKLNWFFLELDQEKMSALFYKTNSVNRIVSTKLVRFHLNIFLFEKSSSKTSLKISSKLIRLLESV